MPDSIKESLDVVCVSTDAQADATTAATIDKKFYLDEGSALQINKYREHNQDEKTGHDLPTRIDEGVHDLSGSLQMAKLRPDFFGWCMAMALNSHAQVTAGSTGFLHTSSLGVAPSNPPYFTMAHQRGNVAGVEQMVGCCINTLDFSFQMGSPVGLTAGILGVGKYTDGHYTEVIAALDNATSLTLAYSVEGDDLDNISIIADLDEDNNGVFEAPVTVTNLSTTTATITSLGGGGIQTINYLCRYLVKNTESGYTWRSFSGISALDEFVIRTNNVKLLAFSAVDDTPSASGGQVVIDEIESLNINLNWNQQVIKGWRTGATIINHSQSVLNGDLAIDITFDRRVRDLMLKAMYEYDADTKFGLHIEMLGPEYEASQAWLAELYFPLIGIMQIENAVMNPSLHGESVTATVMKDTTATDDAAIIARTRNQQDGYFA